MALTVVDQPFVVLRLLDLQISELVARQGTEVEDVGLALWLVDFCLLLAAFDLPTALTGILFHGSTAMMTLD